MFHNDSAIRQLVRVFLGELALILLMLGAYAILGKLTAAVVLGAVVGGVIAIGNFFALSVSVSQAVDYAEKTGDHQKATLMVRGSAPARLLILAVLYILVLKSGRTDVIATILPLIFVQVSLRLTEFFRKDGGNEK